MRYAGWGGLEQVFDESPKAPWAPQDDEAGLQELLTKEEFEAAHTSVPNAHYTSPAVVRAIWEGLASHRGLGIPNDVSIYGACGREWAVRSFVEPRPEAGGG